MPTLNVNGTQLAYEISGSGQETIVFAHGYLFDRSMFALQIAALSDRYRIIAYDQRGHGQSAPFRAPYNMEALVADGLAVARELGGGPVHWIGFSAGGYVGVRLLVRHPELLRSMTLIDTSAAAEPPAALRKYRLMLLAARLVGTRPLLGQVLPIVFGPHYRSNPLQRAELRQWGHVIAGQDALSIVRFGAAIFGRNSVVPQLASVTTPTQIIVGADDVATPPARAREMAEQIPGARLTVLAHCGHMAPIEQPTLVSEQLTAFLAGL